MDPDTALRLMFASLSCGDLDIARSTAIDLTVWVKRGGFIPAALPQDAAKAVAALKTLTGAILALEETAVS